MFGRASIRKSNGRLIEFQSGNPNAVVMIQNAVNAGIAGDDVEIRDISTQTDLDLLMTKDIPAKKDFKYLYKNASTDADKIDVIAQFLKLK
jgi:hypothetical protein